MKRIICIAILICAAAALGLWPFHGVDAAQVIPVETLAVDRQDGEILLYVGDGLTGCGQDLETALADLRSGAPGQVFLGTAERVILAQTAMDLTRELAMLWEVRPSVRVYATAGTVEEADAEILAAQERETEGALLCEVYGVTFGGPAVRVERVEAKDGRWVPANGG